MAYEPTEAELDAALPQAANLAQRIYDFVAVTSTTFLDDIETAVAEFQYGSAERSRARIYSLRRSMDSLIKTQIKPLFDDIFLGYLRLAKSNAPTPEMGWEALQDYFIDESKSVDTRGITVGTVTTSGTGNPTVRVLRRDRNNSLLEGVWPETVDVKTLAAQPTTRSGQEQLELSTARQIDVFSLDNSEDSGDGARIGYTLLNSDNEWLQSSSFDWNGSIQIAGALASLGAWEDSDGTNLAKLAVVDDGVIQSVREQDRARAVSGAPTKQCIEIDDAEGDLTGIFQRLRGIQTPQPYDYGVWIKRRSSATGDFILTVGSKTYTVDISTLTNDVWTFVGPEYNATPANDTQQYHWPQNFQTDDTQFKIETDSLATGALRIDRAFFRPMQPLNGLWFSFLGGTTPIARSYTAAIPLTLAGSDTIIQRWVHMLYGPFYYLPSDGTPSISDP